jgi:hypothetical protein
MTTAATLPRREFVWKKSGCITFSYWMGVHDQVSSMPSVSIIGIDHRRFPIPLTVSLLNVFMNLESSSNGFFVKMVCCLLGHY